MVQKSMDGILGYATKDGYDPLLLKRLHLGQSSFS
jgi:hypothetical protein